MLIGTGVAQSLCRRGTERYGLCKKFKSDSIRFPFVRGRIKAPRLVIGFQEASSLIPTSTKHKPDMRISWGMKLPIGTRLIIVGD